MKIIFFAFCVFVCFTAISAEEPARFAIYCGTKLCPNTEIAVVPAAPATDDAIRAIEFCKTEYDAQKAELKERKEKRAEEVKAAKKDSSASSGEIQSKIKAIDKRWLDKNNRSGITHAEELAKKKKKALYDEIAKRTADAFSQAKPENKFTVKSGKFDTDIPSGQYLFVASAPMNTAGKTWILYAVISVSSSSKEIVKINAISIE